MLLTTFPTYFTNCVCGNPLYERKIVKGSFYKKCKTCGLIRTGEQVEGSKYRDSVKNYDRCYTHTLSQDQEVAQARIGQWNITKEDRVFDIGSGLGCFVDACTQNGIWAEGTDGTLPMVALDRIYPEILEDLHYPASSVSVVTLFDVLEHVSDPVFVLREARRMLQFEGRVLIEFPNFDFEKHWKPKEHFWCLTPTHVRSIAKSVGLDYVEGSLRAPVEGKWALEFKKPEGKRKRLLFPSGIGDSYWSLVKLPALMKEWGETEEPEVSVMLAERDQYRRGLEFLRLVPFVVPGDYITFAPDDPVWKEGYWKDGKVVFENYKGYDAVVMYNGKLRTGHSLSESYPPGESYWNVPLFKNMAQREAEKRFASLMPFVMVHLFDISVHKKYWNVEFPISKFGPVLKGIRDKYNANILALGGPREHSSAVAEAGFGKESRFIDMIQKTNPDEIMALINTCHGAVGHPCGPNLLAACQGRPTVLLWNQYFKKTMWQESVTPAVRGTTYYAEDTKFAKTQELVDRYCKAVAAASGRVRGSGR